MASAMWIKVTHERPSLRGCLGTCPGIDFLWGTQCICVVGQDGSILPNDPGVDSHQCCNGCCCSEKNQCIGEGVYEVKEVKAPNFSV